jgi:hypothetical protein
MDSFFLQLYRFFSARKLVFGISLILIFGFLAFVSYNINFEEDISKLIPTTSENEQLQKVINATNFSDKIIVNISKEDKGATESITAYAENFLDSITANASIYIKNIQGRVNEDTALEALSFVYDNAPLFLSENDYLSIVQKLSTDSIQAITQNNYNTIISPTGIVAKETIIKDPLGISLLGVSHLKEIGLSDNIELMDGFLVTKNGNNLLLFITPSVAASETAQNEIFASKLYQIQNQLNTVFKGKASAQLYGGLLISVANAQQIKKDIQFTVGFALTVLILLFIFFYRNILVPILLFVPTIFGALLAISILFFIRNEISAISLGIGSVLLGVTLDYSLHILTHIRNGDSNEELFASITKPILMSSITTALAFLCLLFIDSQALQDLGIFAAVSVLGASVFALVFIPQFYKNTVLEKRNILDKMAGYALHKNKWMVGVIVVCIIASVFTYHKVIFNKDLSQLNFQTSQLAEAEVDLDKLINTGSKSLYITAYSDILEKALQANEEAFIQLQTLKNSGAILSYNAIGGIVHSNKLQQEKISRWNTFSDKAQKASVKEKLIESGKIFGFKPTTHTQFYELLQKEFQPIPLTEYARLNALAIDDFITMTPNFTTITSIVKVEEENSEAVKSTFSNEENVLVIDRVGMNESLLGNLKNEFNTLLLYCLIVVVVLLLIFYRNIKLTLITIVPIALTWLVTMGIMGVSGLEFNIFNVIVTTFIFGLGVDYCIFMTNGLIKNESSSETIRTHKTSIILSVITTILGVGVLLFAKHPALQSVAVVSIIGIFTAMLIAFTIQPLLYHFLIFKGIKKEQ